jgi:TetR/AcrR family transcriptional regulator, fatty acid metabolism regulator protein
VAKRVATKAARNEREAERRKTILRAAVEVFSRKGFQGCRIADVAREAGVAYGLVYHYFKDKDELLGSVFESGWQGFLVRVQGALSQESDFESRIRSVVNVAFEAYRRDPRGVKVLILEVGRSPSGGAVNRGTEFARVLELAAAMFAEAQAQGQVPRHLDPRLSAALLFGAIEMGLTTFVMGLVERSDEVLERARDQVAETFLRGTLGAKAPVAGSAGSEAAAVIPSEAAPWTNVKSGTKSKAVRRD